MTIYPPIEEAVPHRAPILMIDAVEAESTDSITCRATLRDDCPFIENGAIPIAVSIEIMAQCVATLAGIHALRKGNSVELGYLIGARTVTFSQASLYPGQVLRVTALRVWGDSGLGTFETTLETGGSIAATATLNVYQKPPASPENAAHPTEGNA